MEDNYAILALLPEQTAVVEDDRSIKVQCETLADRSADLKVARLLSKIAALYEKIDATERSVSKLEREWSRRAATPNMGAM